MKNPRAELLTEVRRDIKAKKRELKKLRWIERWLASRPSQDTGAHASADEKSPPQKSTAAPFPPGTTQIDAAEQVIHQLDRPCTAPQIVDELLKHGFVMPGPENTRRKRLINSLASSLHRHPERFVNLGHGLWDVVGREKSKEGDQ